MLSIFKKLKFRNHFTVLASILSLIYLSLSFTTTKKDKPYTDLYFDSKANFNASMDDLKNYIMEGNLSDQEVLSNIKIIIIRCRHFLKTMDFWWRYYEPIAYKKINGPLLIEWENEVFEKHEKPYKREGFGLSLALMYLEDKNITKDSLLHLIDPAIKTLDVFSADSIIQQLESPASFFFCNRLFLLNLAAIYTTGFECPEDEWILPELRFMLVSVESIYKRYQLQYPDFLLPKEYLDLFHEMSLFVQQKVHQNYKNVNPLIGVAQPKDIVSSLDHFTWIQKYVNPLYKMNQNMISKNHLVSLSYIDYSMNSKNSSIFDKSLYHAQNTQGIFIRVKDTSAIHEMIKLGKLLFYDPILSGNNKRSCASCHKPTQYFTDTSVTTSLEFDGITRLPRNSPTLINSEFNHLILLDGKHITLQDQLQDVITNPKELAMKREDLVAKVISCPDYKKAFNTFLKHTPTEQKITPEHIVSVISMYVSTLSQYEAPFDQMMNGTLPVNDEVQAGFNLFMGKAKCGTCHFVPLFNGVKPPYTNSEFEVLGVPLDTTFRKISPDEGRFVINPAYETKHAFRTGSIRNSSFTKPYMHNGVFNTMDEVIEFYNAGGGNGKGLIIENQTLSSDSLKLTVLEKKQLITFIQSLDEMVPNQFPPMNLPKSKNKLLNNRKIGGEY